MSYGQMTKEELVSECYDLLNENAQLRMAVEEYTPWRKWEDERPRPFESFILEWEGIWQRACMDTWKCDLVHVYWHGEDYHIESDRLDGSYWLRIPGIPPRLLE